MARKSRYQHNNDLNIESPIYKAALYCRLSVEDGGELNDSIINQQKIMLDYLKDKTDIEVIEIYIDNGFSGMNYVRPDFQRMLLDIKAGKINCIIVKDISRLGRNFLITSDFVERIFPEMGIRLICINDSYDSLLPMTNSESLLLPFQLAINDFYAKDIAKKIQGSIDAKILNNEFLPSCSSVPYGYLRNEENKTFNVDQEVVDTINAIFNMRASGMKFNAIARQLNEDGVLSPGKLRYVRGITKAKKYSNGMWDRKTIRKITSDLVYLGHRVHGTVKKINGKKTKTSKDDWKIVYNAHPAIISQELFDCVQKVNKVEKEIIDNQVAKGVVHEDRELFRNIIFCADCQSTMASLKGIGRNGESWLYYNCKEHIKYAAAAKEKACSNHYIRHDKILNVITNLIEQQILIALDVERYIDEVKSMPKVIQHNNTIKNQITQIRSQRISVEAKIERLLIDLTEGVLGKEEYGYIKEQYIAKRDKLIEVEKHLEVEVSAIDEAFLNTYKWLEALSTYKKLPSINHEIVMELVERILIHSDKRIEIELKYKDFYAPIKHYVDLIPGGEVLDID